MPAGRMKRRRKRRKREGESASEREGACRAPWR